MKIWFLLLFIKILISQFLPFYSDEAYYWVWGQNPRLSYFDHPPNDWMAFLYWGIFWCKSSLGKMAHSPNGAFNLNALVFYFKSSKVLSQQTKIF